jgi:hypothetical protein
VTIDHYFQPLNYIEEFMHAISVDTNFMTSIFIFCFLLTVYRWLKALNQKTVVSFLNLSPVVLVLHYLGSNTYSHLLPSTRYVLDFICLVGIQDHLYYHLYYPICFVYRNEIWHGLQYFFTGNKRRKMLKFTLRKLVKKINIEIELKTGVFNIFEV